MPETIRVYEIVYIIAPDRSEEQVHAIIDKYNNLITAQGGKVEKTDIWERRRLAYEIKGFHEGIYVISVFSAYPRVEAELRRVLLISEDTLRFVIVRPDDETVALQPTPDFGHRPQYDGGRPVQQAPAPEAVVPVAEIAAPETSPAEETTPVGAASPVAETEPVAEAAPVAETETAEEPQPVA